MNVIGFGIFFGRRVAKGRNARSEYHNTKVFPHTNLTKYYEKLLWQTTELCIIREDLEVDKKKNYFIAQFIHIEVFITMNTSKFRNALNFYILSICSNIVTS